MPESSNSIEAALGRYGQVTPTETPELISTKLKELEISLTDTPKSKKLNYLIALQKCPDQCTDTFKLQHLRCEVFRVQDATKRIIAYWDKRIEIFGEERGFLPLNLEGALKGDEKALQIAYLRPTHEKDDAGRAILFVDPSRMPLDKKTLDRKSMGRAFWYYIHAALEDEDVQRKGFVILAYGEKVKFSHYDQPMDKINMSSIKGCLPVRIAAFHVCHPPTFFSVIFPIMKVFLGERLRKRVKLHTGSHDDVNEILEVKFGVERGKLPTEMGGANVLDHMKWLETRRAAGL